MFLFFLLALCSVNALGIPLEHGMMMWIEDGKVHHSRWATGCDVNPSEGENPIFDANSDTIPEGEQSAVIPSDPVPALDGEEGVLHGPEEAGNDQSGPSGIGFGSSPSFSEEGQGDIDSGLPAAPGQPSTNPSNNDDDGDDDQGNDPSSFNLSPRKGSPSYNVFFPIQLSHGTRGRSASGASGTYSAIANSFSTGRRGIANSHSLAFGDVAPPRTLPQEQTEQKP